VAGALTLTVFVAVLLRCAAQQVESSVKAAERYRARLLDVVDEKLEPRARDQMSLGRRIGGIPLAQYRAIFADRVVLRVGDGEHGPALLTGSTTRPTGKERKPLGKLFTAGRHPVVNPAAAGRNEVGRGEPHLRGLRANGRSPEPTVGRRSVPSGLRVNQSSETIGSR